MTRQLEDAKDAHDPEDLDHPTDVLDLLGAVRADVRLVQDERDVVGENGEYVDEVESALEELPLVGRRPETQKVLEGEPTDADGLDGGKVFVVRRVVALVLALERWKGVERQGNS